MAQVVADTSPLIAFHQIGLFGILEDLMGTILVPPAVASELTPGLPELPAFIREALKQARFWVDPSLYDALLQQAGELG